MMEKFLPNIRIFREMRRMKWRDALYQVLRVLIHFGIALLLWKWLQLWKGTESPITVILSGSMEPTFYRGDALLLVNDLSRAVEVGDIVVFKLAGRKIPILHRVIKLHRQRQLNTDSQKEEKEQVKFLTKGDNNKADDRFLYNAEQLWLTREDVVGFVEVVVPFVGYIALLFRKFPFLRHPVIIALICFELLDF